MTDRATRHLSARPTTALTIAVCAEAALLAFLTITTGLGAHGWTAAALYTLSATALLGAALRHYHHRPLGPADLVTSARVVLIGAVTALVADGDHTWALVAVAVPAMALDALDGLVARGTRTCSDFGARFDIEADAFLILVLSVQVAQDLGPWVLAIGAMRYLFGAATLVLPRLRGPLPPGRGRKTVAAAQPIVLTVAVSGILPPPATTITVAAALTALLWSFTRDVAGLWRPRPPRAATTEGS
ncbi:MAG TPA: CDP-alcohol phosphatidyltransferase family protein [Nocardiopsis listeri]|uniref:CDP-alcohol phosphatidyltransferase family protein n=1 Tax=Nocardiopsis listeri TaxID=53440 RepID=UPI001DDA42EB|nr:CDP-alcohol phosphatidyltransferase family protein [Nocardiopsis listeri]HJE58986.1 CDP-alcohol phosphatidyltransferase family protein [Nocardiopsis listeri]